MSEGDWADKAAQMIIDDVKIFGEHAAREDSPLAPPLLCAVALLDHHG